MDHARGESKADAIGEKSGGKNLTYCTTISYEADRRKESHRHSRHKSRFKKTITGFASLSKKPRLHQDSPYS